MRCNRPPARILHAPQQGVVLSQPTPVQLAQTGRDQLRFPSPQIEVNPAAEQLVNLRDPSILVHAGRRLVL